MKFIRMIFRREGVYAALALLEVLALTAVLFAAYTVRFAAVPLIVLTVCCVLRIISDEISPAYKLGLCVPMLLFPLHGGVFWLLFVRGIARRRLEKRIKKAFVQAPAVSAHTSGTLSDFLANKGMPLCSAENCRYYPFGDSMFREMLDAVRAARERIYIEFFIVSEGTALTELTDALAERAAAGVDVRVLIDGVGSAFVKPPHLTEELRAKGIGIREFNRLSPFRLSAAGIRDHRKILAVDGKVAFCGGINIADEYMNRVERFGVWKDGGFSVCGGAAGSFERMFLRMWALSGNERQPYDIISTSGGTVQPFADIPLDGCRVSLSVYLQIISRAERYVYITTPYLVCDDELIGALCKAAQSGTDVRLILPGIPDKKYVNALTKSYYGVLIRSGVHICEYTPGFVHCKNIVSDDRIAAVGTVNLDYRSMSGQFECGCVFRDPAFAADVRRDIIATLSDCTEVSDCKKTSVCCPRTVLLSEMRSVNSRFVKIARIFLKLFAPLM